MWRNGKSLALVAQGSCYCEIKIEEKEKQKQNTWWQGKEKKAECGWVVTGAMSGLYDTSRACALNFMKPPRIQVWFRNITFCSELRDCVRSFKCFVSRQAFTDTS